MRAHGVVSLFPFFCVRTRPVRAPLLSHVTAKGSLHNLLLAHCNSPHCCRVEPKWRGHAQARKLRAREPFTCFTSSALILIPGGPGGGEGPAIAGSRWWRARPWCGGRAACVTSKRGYEKKGKSERKGRREERKKKIGGAYPSFFFHSRRARTPIRHHHAIQTPTRHCPFFNCIRTRSRGTPPSTVRPAGSPPATPGRGRAGNAWRRTGAPGRPGRERRGRPGRDGGRRQW